MRIHFPSSARVCSASALVMIAVAAMAVPGRLDAAEPLRGTPLDLISPLTDDDGEIATNVSGISCVNSADAARVCLLIDDEGRMAQASVVRDNSMSAAGKITVIGKRPPGASAGTEPRADSCSGGEAKFKDLDGEAVASDGDYFYIVGSHGCSRHSNKFRSSSFLLARISRADVLKAGAAAPNDQSQANISLTFRLSEVLKTVPAVAEFFGRDLETEVAPGRTANGLNIEGLAVANGRLYFGLRAPNVNGQAFIIGVDTALLFAPERPISSAAVSQRTVPLGDGRGIRDLAVLPDGRFLILSGPAWDNDAPYALHALSLSGNDPAKELGRLEPKPKNVKAEGIHVMGVDAGVADLLVVYDGAKGGGATRFKVPIE